MIFSLLQEVKELFQKFDRDGNGQLDFDEFLRALRVNFIWKISGLSF